jgi:hypothetical protein
VFAKLPCSWGSLRILGTTTQFGNRCVFSKLPSQPSAATPSHVKGNCRRLAVLCFGLINESQKRSISDSPLFKEGWRKAPGCFVRGRIHRHRPDPRQSEKHGLISGFSPSHEPDVDNTSVSASFCPIQRIFVILVRLYRYYIAL